ncbi:glycosyltransferase [Urechidicola sp. KH5]
MEKELNCDFYFGNIEEGRIKRIDEKLFTNSVVDLKTWVFFGKLNWIEGMIPILLKKKYRVFILTGDVFCLSNWFFLFINIVLRKEIYLWGHGWYGREGALKSKIKRVFFNLSTGIFLYGNYAKNLMLKENIKLEKLHVIYNSLDYEKQKEIRESLRPSLVFQNHFNNVDPVVIFTGRLTSVKKIDLLIEAHYLLQLDGKEFNVLILGDGPKMDYLKNLVSSKGLEDKYWFYGACYDEYRIGEFYFNSTVCVSPGNVGLTAIHSMSYGCPVISHNNFSNQMPEFEIIKEGRNGLFYEQDNIFDLSRCLLKFIENSWNKEESRRECFKVIDEYYNSNFQLELLKKVLKR